MSEKSPLAESASIKARQIIADMRRQKGEVVDGISYVDQCALYWTKCLTRTSHGWSLLRAGRGLYRAINALDETLCTVAISDRDDGGCDITVSDHRDQSQTGITLDKDGCLTAVASSRKAASIHLEVAAPIFLAYVQECNRADEQTQEACWAV